MLRGRVLRRFAGVPVGVKEDLAKALGEKSRELNKIASQNVEFQYRLEPLKDLLPLICDPAHRDRWRIEGREYLEASIQAGRGAILLTAHLGYSKLITPILRAHGYDAVSVVAKSLDSVEQEERISAWLSNGGYLRERFLQWLLPNSYEKDCIPAQLDIRPILSAIEANRLVLFAGDGLKAADFAQLPLLERTYPFAKGFMKIAMLTGTSVVPLFALEGSGRNYVTVKIEKPLPIDPKVRVEENLVQFARVMERQIRSTPHLWYRWGLRDAAEAMSQMNGGVGADRWNRGVKALYRTRYTKDSAR